MMPFHRPIPESKQRKENPGGLSSYVQAEKLMQIAFVLPSALAICGLAGWGLSRLLHQPWITIAGVIFGCVAGMVAAIQTALAAEKDSRSEKSSKKGSTDKDS
jgi:F0F1-type ATP synthase assembly protein I